MKKTAVILDPTIVLNIGSYHDIKKDDSDSTYGLLYAEQIDERLRICWTSPLGIDSTPKDELVERGVEYEYLRRRGSEKN